jgi:hypothetical protein
MPTTPLFPLPEGLEMTSISETAGELLVCDLTPNHVALSAVFDPFV